MFTGIIEIKGKVLANIKQKSGSRLIISNLFDDLIEGESIAINGVCLTLLQDNNSQLAFDVSPETLNITNLGELSVEDYVNIERAMSATSRFGGHYVSGHVDTKAKMQKINAIDDYLEITIGEFLIEAKNYLLPKGSITLNGVSLTINEVVDDCIKIMLVPHTLDVTTFKSIKEGEWLNVEFDYLTRIVAHQVAYALGNVKA